MSIASDPIAASSATPDPITEALANAFAAEPAPVETPESETPEPTPAEENPPPAEEPAESEEGAEDEAKPEEPKEEEPETPAEETAEEDGDAELEFLTAEELKSRFPRNSSNALIATAARYAEIAKAGEEIKTKLGGEEFVEPLSKMAGALKNGQDDPAALNEFFVGVTEAAGADTLITVLGQALWMGFVKADEWAKDPATKDFAGSIQQVVDASVLAKYGVDSQRLQRMAEWEKIGWFDKLEEWISNQYVPPTELDELLEINNNPTLRKLAEENHALKHQQDAKKPVDESTDSSAGRREFEEHVAEKIQPLLNDVLWKRSPLMAASSDSPEVKEAKAFLREALVQQTLDTFNQSQAASKLAADFQKGKHKTAIYGSTFTETLNAAIQQIRPKNAVAERLLAKLYPPKRGTSPDPQPSASSSPPPTETLPPTTPQVGQPANTIKSTSEIENTLAEAFRQLG